MSEYVFGIGHYDTIDGSTDGEQVSRFNSLYDAQNEYEWHAARMMVECALPYTKRERERRNVTAFVADAEGFDNICCEAISYCEMPASALTDCEDVWNDRFDAEHFGAVAVSFRWNNGQETDVLWFDCLDSLYTAFAEAWINDLSDANFNPPRMRVWEYVDDDEQYVYPIWTDPTNGRKMTTEY